LVHVADLRRATGNDMNKRILIVEDQEDNRRILRDLLAHTNYTVMEAVTGEEGVRLALTSQPDLILMDIQLPIIDGYEATCRIKAVPNLSQVPIIVITSYALSGDEERARAAGCDAYVAKPYSPMQLLSMIHQYLS
jgi:two-component system, cell cycle response regulator DivK